MAPYFEEGVKQFQMTSGIALTGISFDVVGRQLVVTITEEQEERWLFQLAFTIGLCYGRMVDIQKSKSAKL